MGHQHKIQLYVNLGSVGSDGQNTKDLLCPHLYSSASQTYLACDTLCTADAVLRTWKWVMMIQNASRKDITAISGFNNHMNLTNNCKRVRMDGRTFPSVWKPYVAALLAVLSLLPLFAGSSCNLPAPVSTLRCPGILWHTLRMQS